MSIPRPPSPSVKSPRPPRSVLLITLRVVVTLLFVLLAAQVAFIAGYLGGSSTLLSMHSANAFFLTVVAFAAFVVAIFFYAVARGAFWPLPVSGIMWLLLFVQEILGYTEVIALHIPLGVSIVAFGLVLVVAVWRLRYEPRPRRVRSATPELA